MVSLAPHPVAVDAAEPPAVVSRRAPRALPRIGAALLVTVAVLPLVIALTSFMADPPSIVRESDTALIELDVQDTLRGEQALGPYSQYHWHHPGPAWYGLLAPVYTLFGSSAASLDGALLLINLLFAAATVLVARSYAGMLGAAVAGGGILALLAASPQLFTYLWNPLAVVLPTLLVVLLAGRVAAGSTRSIVGLLLVATFLAQTHVGTVPVVFAVSTVAMVAWTLRRVRRKAAHPPPRSGWLARLLLAAGLALAVVAWLPPVAEWLGGDADNNVALLTEFFTTNETDGIVYAESDRTATESLSTVGRAMGVPFGDDLEAAGFPEAAEATSQTATIRALAAFGLAGVLLAVGKAWRDRAMTSMALVLAAALTASVLAVQNIVGDVRWYLLTWAAVLPIAVAVGLARLGAPPLAAILARVAGRVGRRRRWVRPAGAAVATGLLLWYGLAVVADPLADFATAEEPGSGSIEINRKVLTALPERVDPSAGPIRVDIDFGPSWIYAAPLVLELRDEGWDPAVNPGWMFMFGDDLGPGRAESARIVLTRADQRPGFITGMIGFRSLGSVPTALGDLRVWMSTTPA